MDTLSQAADQVQAQRAAIERKLVRIRRLLIDGLIQRLVPPAQVVDLEKAAALLNDLVRRSGKGPTMSSAGTWRAGWWRRSTAIPISPT